MDKLQFCMLLHQNFRKIIETVSLKKSMSLLIIEHVYRYRMIDLQGCQQREMHEPSARVIEPCLCTVRIVLR